MERSSPGCTSEMLSNVELPLVLVGEPSSLTSLKLERRPSEAGPFEFPCLWGNFTPLRDLPDIETDLDEASV